MKIRMSLLVLLAALFCSPLSGMAMEEKVRELEPDVIGGEDPQDGKCCKFLAIILDPGPQHSCFGLDADSDGDVDGCTSTGKIMGIDVEACNGTEVAETVTVLFNGCKDRDNSQCQENSQVVNYTVHSGTLSCPADSWEDHGGLCLCKWERDPPVGIDIGWPIPISIDLSGQVVQITRCIGGPCPIIVGGP